MPWLSLAYSSHPHQSLRWGFPTSVNLFGVCSLNPPNALVSPLFSAGEEFLCLACDGLWDVLDARAVVDFVEDHLKDGKDTSEVSEARVLLPSFFVVLKTFFFFVLKTFLLCC